MKLIVQVGHVYQLSGKTTDINRPLPVTWDVLLFTNPHIGDINLRSDNKEFAEWAKKLNCNEFVELVFSDQSAKADKNAR